MAKIKKKKKKAKQEEGAPCIGRSTEMRIGEWFEMRLQENYKKKSTDTAIASEARREFPGRVEYSEVNVMRRRCRFNREVAPAKKQLSEYGRGGKVADGPSTREKKVFNKSKKTSKKTKVAKGKQRKAA